MIATDLDLGALLHRSTVQISASPDSVGSGVIWRADGVIISNAHVVHAPRMPVALWSGEEVPARLIARDTHRDLAALVVDPHAFEEPLVPVATRDPRTLRVGELVIALGAPWGVAGALAMGIVHAVSHADGDREPRAEVVRADIRLAPGNSGGPLADAAGRVVGVNAMIVGGLGLAISARTVERFLQEIAPRLARARAA